METFTQAFGTRGINHYNGLLARNACHFAPYSWYRWEQYHLQARAFAEQASEATGSRKDRLTNLAWIHHGYADHFLHDSFAAGHLINKTLVMQWYLDWVGNTWTPVPDWDLVQFMTPARQPDLAGRPLYSAFDNPGARGEVRDPQTASEHWSLARRMAVTGVRATAARCRARTRDGWRSSAPAWCNSPATRFMITSTPRRCGCRRRHIRRPSSSMATTR